MKDKNILIIGASQGIGRGTAETLIAQGAKVVVVARNKESLEELSNKYPNQVLTYPYDVEDLEHIEDIFEECKSRDIKLDGMVYCVGTGSICPIKMLDAQQTEKTYRINLHAYLQFVKYFSLKKYSSERSSVVAISSISSFRLEKSMLEYATSKAAMNAATSVMSKELTKRRIRVNAIAPAIVNTAMLQNSTDSIEDYDCYIVQQQPFGLISVEQVADLIVFLLSSKSQYITGSVIPISAGMAL